MPHSGIFFPSPIFIFFPYTSRPKIRFMKKQTTIPVAVGMRAAASVQRRLFVSLLTVNSVVRHGLCMRQNTIMQTAVTGVQPFEASSP